MLEHGLFRKPAFTFRDHALSPAQVLLNQSKPMTRKRFLVVRDDAPDAALHGAVVALGNLDGARRGPRAVIAAAGLPPKPRGKPPALLPSEPQPRTFFVPGEPLFRLTDE